MKIVDEARTREILKKNNLRLQKRLGQNFLIHEPTVNSIIDAANLIKDDFVIEIGPGIGSLTQQLADTGAKVIAVELDQKLLPILRTNLKEYHNVEVIHADALKVDFDQLASEKTKGVFGGEGEKYKIVANLPYYITTPIIMHLLENKYNIFEIIIMIQKEVALRLTAKPGSKDYGAITVSAGYYAQTEVVTHVPPAAFIPPPGVNSTVIKLKVLEEPPVKLLDEKGFFKIIKGAFGQRRKTLLNALGNLGLGHSKEELAIILHQIEIDPNRRGETLSLQEFSKIANTLADLKNI